MKQAIAVLMALMLTAVSLAGCSGEDVGPYQERIDELEASAQSDKDNATALGASLSEIIATHEATIANHLATISSLNAQILVLEAQIASLNSQVAYLNLQNMTKDSTIYSQASDLLVLDALKSALEGQVASLEADNAAALSEIASLEAEKAAALPVIEALLAEMQAEIDSLQALASELNNTIRELGGTSTLDLIVQRGYMICGVKESQYGMGYLDSGTGVRSGLDISYCRAIAAAIGLDSDTDIDYVPASGSNRFDMLASGIIDVLIRTTTWTTSRDADLNADFAAMNFYDGQGILVREDSYSAATAGYSALGLDGANICVGIGTTSEGNLVDWFSSMGISFTSVPVSDSAEATAKLIDGQCDALTGDMSALVAKKWQLDSDDSVETWIAQETLSKEPLGAVTRDYDSEWNEIVAWVWYGMVTAEEMGVTSANYAASATSACEDNGGYPNDQFMCRLLTEDFGLGTTDNPLAGDWMQDVLEAVGNYGEAYDDAFCDGTYDGVSGSDAMTGCLISRSGTLNALVSEGGIQYAPSMR
ncbi:MAG: transporter substrate-binding domain-containing protein [Candidatus Thermoplasmatota archaeon]|nr:transporter substrate-binding domain-containing protein [Candidatus Thermoplasmatota archaeon]